MVEVRNISPLGSMIGLGIDGKVRGGERAWKGRGKKERVGRGGLLR